jgi:hypothetical protein
MMGVRCMRAGLAKGYYGKFTGEAKELDKVRNREIYI